jgi:hypothetical protein
MKIQILPIIITIFFLSCSTQQTAVDNWFPNGIIRPPVIAEYIKNFNTDDIYVARNTYIGLLAFIEEMIDAHHENIARAYRFDTPTVKCSALIDGKLTIIESTVSVSYLMRWDDDLEQYVEVGPSGDAFTESLQIYHNSLMYNELLDNWFSLTGELLGEYIDAKAVWEKLLEDYIRENNLEDYFS